MEGNVKVVMERFTIERTVGDIEIFFSTLEEQDRDHSMNQMIERVNCRFRVRWQE